MAGKSGSGQTIDIGQLSIQQLNQLSQQLDHEIEVFQSSLSQLKMAQNKFIESQECLNKIKPERNGSDILVPLTSSMYVSGQLSDLENVMIDIGTGYYVEKDVAGAKDYFKRKVEFVTQQMEKIQPALQEKAQMKQAVVEVMQLKVQATMMAQQQAQKAGTSK